MPNYDDRAVAPPGSATVVMIVILSIIVLIASGYVIYNYSSPRPNPATQSAPTQSAPAKAP